MLNEFYDFIAKKINSFFQTAAADGTLLKGESFCLMQEARSLVCLELRTAKYFLQAGLQKVTTLQFEA